MKLELNEWNGAVEPRVVLGELYPRSHRRGALKGGRFPADRGMVAPARR